jgi:hypothetical protein
MIAIFRRDLPKPFAARKMLNGWNKPLKKAANTRGNTRLSEGAYLSKKRENIMYLLDITNPIQDISSHSMFRYIIFEGILFVLANFLKRLVDNDCENIVIGFVNENIRE